MKLTDDAKPKLTRVQIVAAALERLRESTPTMTGWTVILPSCETLYLARPEGTPAKKARK